MEKKSYNSIPSNETFKSDLNYIKNEIIAKQKNGLYCKVSRILRCITVTNMSKENYIAYWTRAYKYDKGHPERIEKIKEEINNLFPLEKVINIQLNSNDPKELTDKIIKEITIIKEKQEI